MARHHGCWLAAALLLLSLQACKATVEVKMSTAAPGGLSGSDVPQFIIWSHDDEVNAESTGLVLEVADARKNPNGCRLPVTWFVCTSYYCGFECSYAKSLYDHGHELATHTMTHPGLRFYDKGFIEEEVVGAREALVNCSIPREAVTGFRTPYLSDKAEVREVLSEHGFRYDSTIGVKGGKDKPWPATMESGVPYDCLFSENFCDDNEKHPGLWEVPLYSSVGPNLNLMDYCTVEGDGSARPGCSAYETLKQMLDEAYTSNRAPVSVGVHKPYLKKDEFRADVGKFLDYALTLPDVWVVTHTQLLDWMEAPVKASEMAAFMANYPCP